MCESSYIRQIDVFCCTNLAEVILEDGREIKTELLKPLIRAFLEVIKQLNEALGELCLEAVLRTLKLAEKGTVFTSSSVNPCKQALGANTGLLLKPTVSSSVRWNAALSGYRLLGSGGCVAQSNTSRAAACPFVSAQEKETTGCSSVACKMISVPAGEGVGGDVIGSLKEMGRRNLSSDYVVPV